MRIAYVIPSYPPDPTEPFVVNEMIEVAQAGHEIVLVALYAAPATAVRHATYERLRPLAVLPPALCDLRVVALAAWMLLTRPWRVLQTLAALHRAAGPNPYAHARLLAVAPKALATAWRVRRLGVDRIHAHFANERADCAAIAGRVAGIPFSFTAHAFDIYATARRRRNDTLGWKLEQAVQAFAVSDFAAARLRACLPPAERGRVHTARVGIPLDLFRAEPPPPTDGGLRLLAIARLLEKKGLDTLIEAAALLRARGLAFRLRILGDGPLREALAAQVERLGVGAEVALGGAVPQERVAREMRDAHVFVLPCRQDRSGDMDGIPTVFMEAMASGRPVVSTAISGIPELVRDGETGLVVPPEDPPALAAALVRLARDEALRLRLGRQARALVERQHDQRRNARRLLALMEAAGAGGSRPTRDPAAVDASGPG
jgi:glycosyltransferase involved in cell wall biosynthesis